jgi:hypothetical protein
MMLDEKSRSISPKISFWMMNLEACQPMQEAINIQKESGVVRRKNILFWWKLHRRCVISFHTPEHDPIGDQSEFS